jgi:putative two-component system response regulator
MVSGLPDGAAHVQPVVGATDSAAGPEVQEFDQVLAGEYRDLRIMIVDDEPINVSAVRKHLKMAGCANVVGITDSTTVINAIRQAPPDLLLLDILMPEISGLEILEQLHADPELRHLPVIVLSASSDPGAKRRALALGATDFLSKPAEFVELVARVQNCLAVKAYDDHLKSYAEDLARRVRERTAELSICRLEEIQCLSRAAECRADLTQMHSTRVSGYAGVLVRRLGLDGRIGEAIELAASLHDVGKIGFPDSLLSRSDWFTQEEIDLLRRHGVSDLAAYPALTPDECSTFKSHTVAGSRIMAAGRSPILELGAIIAMSHHENWDGSGYPSRLAGDKIPLEGRIVAVANAFDVFSARQSQGPAFSEDECLEIVADGAGTHFDPQVVAALVGGWREILEVKSRFRRPREAAKRR